MRPCQGRETGSIPVTRSESNPKGLFFILEEKSKKHASFTLLKQAPFLKNILLFYFLKI
jgi:hypothetical protein